MKNLIMLLAFISFQSFSDDTKKLRDKIIEMELPNSRVITVTAHPDYAPVVWNSVDRKSINGVAYRTLSSLLREINIAIEVLPVTSWGRAQQEVKIGRADILLPPYLTEERKLIYSYVKTPFMNDDTVVFVKKGSEFKFEKFSDLKGKKGVALINDSFGTEFDKYQNELSIKRLTKSLQCLKFLIAKRADYYVAGKSAVELIAKDENLTDEISYLSKPVISTGMYFAFSKKSKWDIPIIRKYLDARLKELEKENIKEHH